MGEYSQADEVNDAAETWKLLEEIRALSQVCCVALESPSKHGCGSVPRGLGDQSKWVCFVTSLYEGDGTDTTYLMGASALEAVRAAHEYAATW